MADTIPQLTLTPDLQPETPESQAVQAPAAEQAILSPAEQQAVDQFLQDLEVSTEYTNEMYEGRTLMMKVRMAVSKHLVLLA